jgi:diadenosine tetraphosphate (Ap4A) HIT family hydrolase
MSDPGWQLDPRLAEGSAALGGVGSVLIRAQHSAPWPWLILIPRQLDAVEWFDLHEPLRTQSYTLALTLGAALKREFGADKINIAAIGNVVPQLHIHIVARKVGDSGWPGPVWGRAEPPLAEAEQSARLQRLRVVVLQVALGSG